MLCSCPRSTIRERAINRGGVGGPPYAFTTPPSAVSLQLGKLEDVLSTQLLHRNARRIALTEQGEVLLAYAGRLTDTNDEARAAFHTSSLTGHVRLGAPPDLDTAHAV
ncbi:MAG: LysR family transcriptional regulator [Acetobacter sp.]|uniref:LysR family transcriptional regulator n=1 Tax=Acetobacter sp. TaxID=440 RepID=UPI0039EADF4F